jgi:cytoskeletal protein CcmA (bactofilin family)
MLFKKLAKNLLDKEVVPQSPQLSRTHGLPSHSPEDSEEYFPSFYKDSPSFSVSKDIGEEAHFDEEPETIIGENVTMKGELHFKRLLRIDGTFEGDLISNGKLIVGPKGSVKAHINLQEAFISGKVDGNITVTERLVLRGRAEVHGDITAPLLSVDEGVSIVGIVTVRFPQPATLDPIIDDSF